VEGVERVEELLFGLRLASKELNVVDEEHVDTSVQVLEAVQSVPLQCGDEPVRERLDRGVAHGYPGLEGGDVVRDRVQEMCRAETWRRMQEERVVGLAGRFGDSECCGVSQAVAVADDELLEGMPWVEPLDVLDLCTRSTGDVERVMSSRGRIARE